MQKAVIEVMSKEKFTSSELKITGFPWRNISAFPRPNTFRGPRSGCAPSPAILPLQSEGPVESRTRLRMLYMTIKQEQRFEGSNIGARRAGIQANVRKLNAEPRHNVSALLRLRVLLLSTFNHYFELRILLTHYWPFLVKETELHLIIV
ncbi:hypothetical protein CBL_08905 [Carabus blaptoides fortunei]